MEFCYLRVARPVLVASALVLFTSVVSAPFASGQAAAGQQPAAQKNYKDRAEYDLYSKVTQTSDPKARLELLNTWQDKYPQSDFSQERLQYFVATLAQLAASDPSQRQKLIEKCNDLLKMDPKNFQANYLISVWGPAVGGSSPSPELQSQVETAAHAAISNADSAFDPSKKPANISQADFEKAKSQAMAIAHNALAWVAVSKKDNATAANEYKASLEANPDQGTISYQYGTLVLGDKSIPEDQRYPVVLWEYARAAQYTGPGPTIPANAQTQVMDYVKKLYNQYHGSADGLDNLLSQAKTSALPPQGFSIGSASAAAAADAKKLQDRIDTDPGFKIWYAVKQSLTEKGDAFFGSDVKDTELPGDTVPSKSFTGTVISLDPPDRPTKVVLGVEDPTKPDATLIFSQPLPASALDKIKTGEKLDFSGVAESYTKDPYMLTFKDPTIPGVQTTAPVRHGRKKR